MFIAAPGGRLNPQFLLAEPPGGLETAGTMAVSLARSPQLAGRVVRAAAVPGLTARQFLRDSSVKPTPDSSVLVFSVSYHRRAFAVRLTSAYAGQFVRFFKERWMETLGAPRLELVLSPQKPTALIFGPAHVVSSFRPHALRDQLFGGAFGALLGIALALAAVRLRTRA